MEINKKKQIEEMAKLIYAGRALGKSPTEVALVLRHAGYRKQEWISVDERLPEESGIYLVVSNLGNRLILDYSARHKLFNSFDSYSTEQAKGFAIAVTHWMPLPEAPKMKGGTK